MADYLTIWEAKGDLEGLKVAFVGDGNNVAHSLMFAGAQLGSARLGCHPAGLRAEADALCMGQTACAARPAEVAPITNDAVEAVRSGRGLHRRVGQHGAGRKRPKRGEQSSARTR